MEILAPAGSLQKLKYAIRFGADAVYTGGRVLNLRSKSSNLTDDQLTEAVQFCHTRKTKLYVTLNAFAHNEDLTDLPQYIKFLSSINVDAIIVSDPAVFSLVKEYAPATRIHISTQANVTSWKSAEFWYNQGASRIILARELSLPEIKFIKQKLPDLELEIFVHGAMCMSYSGRCLLSAFLNGRDANRGNCSHPCRWKYSLVEETRENTYFPIEEDENGTYILNSKDLCLFNRLEDLYNAGLSSLKIEGRMKSLYYVATLSRLYKQAIEEISHNEKVSDFLKEELDKVSHRIYTEGFIDGFDSSLTQNYDSSSYIRNYQFLGTVIKIEGNIIFVEVRSKFSLNDEIEVIFPRSENDIKIKVNKIMSEDSELISFTKPNTVVKLEMPVVVEPHGILRMKI
ncbi:U32 family peptidase [Candidatus Cloacimonadota bacterium]